MATNIKHKKRCGKCHDNINNNNGCKPIYCEQHVIQHRKELNNQLELIIQEYDLIKDQDSQWSSDHILFNEINLWEKNSIIKIQKIAQSTRNDLQQLINHSNQCLRNLSENIGLNLCLARQTNDFLENDLEKWKKQIDKLKNDIQLPISCNLVKDKHSSIYLIKIETNNSIEKNINFKFLSTIEEKFGEIYGPIQLDRLNLRCKYIGNGWEYGRIRGYQKYSQGRHIIKFKIENSKAPEQMFLGITTSSEDLDQQLWNASSTIGWSGDNSIWQHGFHDQLHNQFSNEKFHMGDILELILNCKQQQIELYNQRTNNKHILPVDINQTPFPWQFLIGLRTSGDCVVIL